MPSFSYAARDSSGQTRRGVLEASSPQAATAELRQQGWLVLRLESQAGSGERARPTRSLLQRLLAPRSVQIELSLRQLAVMLRGGISLLAAMQTIANQSEHRAIRMAYQQLIDQVEQGQALSDAMATQPGFPEFLVRLVRVGERTGIQETVLVRGADTMRGRRETVREITTALSYPLIVLLAAGGATVYMVTQLIPKLTKLLEGLGKPLPPITASLVSTSHFIQQWSVTLLVATLGGTLLGAGLYCWPPGRLAIDRAMLRIPVLGKILRLGGTLAFADTLGTLLGSGVTVLDSLGTVQQMHGNRYLARIVLNAREAVIRGNNLADSLRTRGAYMPLLATMTAVGEQSGNLDEVLEEVSAFYTAQLKALIKSLSAWMTPAIIVAVGSVVGYVYIAFFVGMFAVAR